MVGLSEESAALYRGALFIWADIILVRQQHLRSLLVHTLTCPENLDDGQSAGIEA